MPLFLFEAPVGSFLHAFDLSWALLAGAYAVPATQDPRCSWHGPAGKLRGRGRALVVAPKEGGGLWACGDLPLIGPWEGDIGGLLGSQ